MKRVLLATVLAGVLAFGGAAHAQSTGEQVQSFDVLATVHPDASVSVTETIVYDFGTNERHGIYRDIPISYKINFGSKTVTLGDVHVTDESGKPYRVAVSYPGSNEELKIGDPNVLVSGTKTYVISYTVARAISYFNTYDELYWNATGNTWQVPIQEASAAVVLPGDYTQAACYEGAQGSTERCAQDLSLNSSHTVRFTATRSLGPGEGLTVAVGFAKGLVAQPTLGQNLLQLLLDNWVLGLPVLVLIGMTALWWVKGRDPRGRGTIVPEYEAPDRLAPLELAAVRKEGGSLKNAISAEIIYLATKGYLRIEKLSEKILFLSHTDYRLHRLKPSDNLPAYDANLMEGLFANADAVELSSLKKRFYRNVAGISKAAVDSTVARGYFAVNPTTVRLSYIAAGMAIALGSFLIAQQMGVAAMLSGMISGAIIMLFGVIMPRTTKTGAILRERIKGLKMYLEVAEKARIEFHNAPEKNPQLFEALLPYAMVLGVEKQWAKQFEGIYTEPPAWYTDPSMTAFNASLFANSLSSFSASANQTLASAPQGGSGSGGGGFSGGGMGGGGGGSW